MGQCLMDLCPLISNMVPKRISNRRTIQEALNGISWIRDIHGVLSFEIILEFIRLCNVLPNINLQPGVEDVHRWRLSSTGQYSCSSAYEVQFHGSIQFGLWERIWKSWAPEKCRFFLWLVAHDRCWTADHLARRNLPHPESCPLCDQEDETIHHILVGCVFARQFWHILLRQAGLELLSPQPSDTSFEEWWNYSAGRVHGEARKKFNTTIILRAWILWRHRNDCVFNGREPNLAVALILAGNERSWWSLAGAGALAASAAAQAVD
ncbi:hypothetical protein PR202_ga12209 [Eleusine coracana subsp. coracana]|uniref:Reverse transcriptase zinc-binding domain-containing protein n=1 Tax=Eleusine coracana subsp. coracana TaxID=191504 RepID=A0AAV5CAX6_ELECO|nr:hypothetical protein PR202_ga12209 [Eleusine coracana subsp. coracana]